MDCNSSISWLVGMVCSKRIASLRVFASVCRALGSNALLLPVLCVAFCYECEMRLNVIAMARNWVELAISRERDWLCMQCMQCCAVVCAKTWAQFIKQFALMSVMARIQYRRHNMVCSLNAGSHSRRCANIACIIALYSPTQDSIY